MTFTEAEEVLKLSTLQGKHLTKDMLLSALRVLLQEGAKHYYELGQPILTDEQYNSLAARYAEINGAPFIPEDFAATDSVKIDHVVPMQSIESSGEFGQLTKFFTKTTALLPDATFTVEPKLDGVALCVRYDYGKLTAVSTRGRRTAGRDLTARFCTTDSVVPRNLSGDVIPELVEIWGEYVVSNLGFNQFNQARALDGNLQFATPRHLAIATLATDAPVNRPGATFIVHGFGALEPRTFATFAEYETLLLTWGFTATVLDQQYATGVIGTDITELEKAITRQKYLNDCLPYMTDGIVVKVNRFADRKQLGVSPTAPKWAYALKIRKCGVVGKVTGMVYQTGRTGEITPVLTIEPIEVERIRVERINLSNWHRACALNPHVGDRVTITLAGGIIPVVTGLVAGDDRSCRLANPDAQPKCPSCGAPPTATGAKLFCSNLTCPEQVTGKILNIFNHPRCRIKGYGIEAVRSMVVGLGLTHPAQVFTLFPAEIARKSAVRITVDRATELMNQLDATARSLTVVDWLELFSIRGLGRAKAGRLGAHVHFEEFTSTHPIVIDPDEWEMWRSAISIYRPEIGRKR